MRKKLFDINFSIFIYLTKNIQYISLHCLKLGAMNVITFLKLFLQVSEGQPSLYSVQYFFLDECGSKLLHMGHEWLEKGRYLFAVSAYGDMEDSCGSQTTWGGMLRAHMVTDCYGQGDTYSNMARALDIPLTRRRSTLKEIALSLNGQYSRRQPLVMNL